MGTEPGGQPERVAPGLAARAQTRMRVANRIGEYSDARVTLEARPRCCARRPIRPTTV
jgi:hypothetical protein